MSCLYTVNKEMQKRKHIRKTPQCSQVFFGWHFSQKGNKYRQQKKYINHQHLHSLPDNGIPFSWGFFLNPPPRPRPLLSFASTAAFASRSRSTTESWPSRPAQCSGVLPREPRPEDQATGRTQQNEGGENSQKFVAPQKSKSWKLWPLFSLKNIVVLRCFDDIVLVENTVSFGLWQSRWHG